MSTINTVQVPVVDGITVDMVVAKYVRVRQQIDEMKKRHTEELKSLTETQNLLTDWIMKFLETTGATSVKTKEGTCYSSTRYTASLADADAFMRFVIDKGLFDLLDRRANSTAVRDFVEENKTLPPGCNLSAIRTIGVRKA